MSWEIMLLLLIGILFLMLLMGQWIAFALGLSGMILLFVGGGLHTFTGISSVVWNNINSYILIAVPLFLFMGQLILLSGVSRYFYDGVASLLYLLPGGLLYTNIVACAIFAAVSGSSVATAASVGTVAIPEMTKQGYSSKMVMGSLAAGGTLGILIPPSIIMILYGALVQRSVAKLFIAGIVPGIIMTVVFMIYIGLRLTFNKKLAPRRKTAKLGLRRHLAKIVHILPIIALLIVVLGGIYIGMTTPTEAAAIGALGAFILAFAYRGLNMKVLRKALLSAVNTSCMVLFIIVGAQILSSGLSYVGVPRGVSQWIVDMNLSKWTFFMALVILYVILGFFVDGISMIYITLPVLYPAIVDAGFDIIWFGVVLTILIELGQITPPVGLNLFAIHGISGGSTFNEVIIGTAPYTVLMLITIALLTKYPQLALWLTTKM